MRECSGLLRAGMSVEPEIDTKATAQVGHRRIIQPDWMILPPFPEYQPRPVMRLFSAEPGRRNVMATLQIATNNSSLRPAPCARRGL